MGHNEGLDRPVMFLLTVFPAYYLAGTVYEYHAAYIYIYIFFFLKVKFDYKKLIAPMGELQNMIKHFV